MFPSGPPKKQRFHYPPEFWDGLSKIWLEPGSLRELNRRNRSAPRSQNAESNKEHLQYAPDFLRDCSPAPLDEIKNLAKSGGLDLTDLRNYSMPQARSSGSPSESSSDTNSETTATTPPSAYAGGFVQHLIDHGVYPHGYHYPNGPRVPKPNNFDEIIQRLGRSRRSLF